MLGLLADAARRYGQAIAMVTHDPVAASYADRIVLLADGRVAAEYPHTDAAGIAALMLSLEDGR